MELGSEKEASSWLSVLPIEEHGFTLHKGAFRYSWTPSHLPSRCVCSHPFSIDHALTCPTEGYPTIRHNELKDFTTKIMSEVCHDVRLEPHLQPLTGESFTLATANTEDAARLNISALGVWGNWYQCVFNLNALSYHKLQLSSPYQRQEREKKRQYE